MSAALRYARAGVEAAHEAGGQKAVDSLADSCEGFRDALHASNDLREILRNPALSGERAAILKKVLGALKANEQAVRLLELFIDAHRLPEIDELAMQIRRIADEAAGRQRATCKSVIELPDAQVKRIEKALEKRLGRKVQLEVTIEPELLGGLVIEVGDLTIDSSVRHQLELLRENLAGVAH